MNQRFLRMTSRLLIVSVLGLGMPLEYAHAGLVGTEKVATSAKIQSDQDRIRAFLDRDDVRKELQKQGIDAKTAKARVDVLTDEEVEKVAGRLDKMPAGGDIIGVLFAVFVILLVTDILGFTKVFSFTRPIK